MSEAKFAKPLPIKERWIVGITRELMPTAIISQESGEIITKMALNAHDQIVNGDVLRHLVESHNYRVNEARRKAGKL
jgi:hypothetical protein